MFKLMRWLIVLLLAAPVFAEATPEEVARTFYRWVQTNSEHDRERIAHQRERLTPQLYAGLVQAFSYQPPHDFLDFDPWANNQTGSTGYDVGRARIHGESAKLPVTVHVPGGGTSGYTLVMQHSAAGWQISNLVYAPGFNLVRMLKEINKR